MKRTLLRAGAGLALVGLVLVGCNGSSGKGSSAATVISADRAQVDAAVEKVFPALIRIYVVRKAHRGGRAMKFLAAGSGAIISPEGYAITNHHVVGKARYIRVTLSNREEVEADLIGSDALSDLAIIKLKPETMRKPVKQFPFASFGDSSKVRVGDVVLAMGSPGAISQSVTRGVVANTKLILPGGGNRLDGERVGSVVRWIAHDAQIFGGNSGGPLVSLDGEIIGINEIGVAALGGAIPSNLAKYVSAQLIKHGRVPRSTAGMELRPLLRSSSLSAGVLVNGVIKGLPAGKAGLKPGDIVTSYDGKPVLVRWGEELPAFTRMILETPVGKTVAVTALRNGKELAFKLTTVERGKARDEDLEIRSWGATFRNLTPIAARERKRKNADGVLVGSIRPGGACGQAKPQVRPGDVIVKIGAKEIKSLEDLTAITSWLIAGKTEPVSTVVAFERHNARLLTAVKIGPPEEPNRAPEVRKAWFPAKVQVFTRDLARAMKLKGKKGVLLTQIYPGNTAEKAGFKLGDIITHLDGQSIDASQPEDANVFPAMIRRYKIGSKAEMTVLRGGQRKKIEVELVRAPVPVREMKRYKDEVFEFTGRNLAYMDRATQKWSKKQKGVFVAAVEMAGWAALAGLRGGDLLLTVDGKPVDDVSRLEKVMKALRKSRPRQVTFFVRRGIHTRYLELEPHWEKSK
jgi:serine protease Do